MGLRIPGIAKFTDFTCIALDYTSIAHLTCISLAYYCPGLRLQLHGVPWVRWILLRRLANVSSMYYPIRQINWKNSDAYCLSCNHIWRKGHCKNNSCDNNTLNPTLDFGHVIAISGERNTLCPSWAIRTFCIHLWSGSLHYGLTGGWVQKFKGSYLLCFLHSALVFKARGQCDHHAFPLA